MDGFVSGTYCICNIKLHMDIMNLAPFFALGACAFQSRKRRYSGNEIPHVNQEIKYFTAISRDDEVDEFIFSLCTASLY